MEERERQRNPSTRALEAEVNASYSPALGSVKAVVVVILIERV
jgi:hypothetical protein